ncbi:hypothetical protein [uncultured Roseibium sp.]|uniref:hypothetical protein n=1 Tax=uncultured Roseibium sp. TaxID=1936171 RepID=UPI00261A42F4|nr:hypothetical protein [uncultured Roseibium sp.]
MLFNLHWKYKNTPGGCIQASRERVAKLAKCSKKTVEVALKRFRQEGVIATQRYGKGGRKPTVYRFSIEQLMEVYEPTKKPVVIPGRLVELPVKKGVSQVSEVRENRAGNANEYIYNIYSSYPEASEPDVEDWWAGLISSQDDSPNDPLPEGKNSFLEWRVA